MAFPYIKHDWDRALQEYEHQFKEYRLEKQAFKMLFGRVPNPAYMWNYKYESEETNKILDEKRNLPALKMKHPVPRKNRINSAHD